MKTIPTHVFRTYDIRGLVDKDFDEEAVERLGKACGALFLDRGQKTCVLGHDARLSSPAYRDAMAAGLRSTGVNAIDIGMVPTPLLYFAVLHLGLPAGIMVTASHNPAEYNGFKIWSGSGTLRPEDIRHLKTLLDAGNFPQGQGAFSSTDVRPAYREAITSRVNLARPLKVVVDGGNGAGGELCVAILRSLGAEIIPLYCEPDGRFPHHHPDPVVEKNMAALAEQVRQSGADLGVGLDGDADRLGVVDETGKLLYGDELLALYSREVLARVPGAGIIADVKCSHRLFRDIEEHGGKGEMFSTGHSLVKRRLRETGALLAGEMSGHMFFVDRWFGFDDAIYAAARLLELAAASTVPLSRMLQWPPTACTPEIHLDCPEDIKFALAEKAKAFFRQRYTTIEQDGVRLVFPDGWGLVRASNTQPVLVLRFEAESPERLEEIRKIVETPVHAWLEEYARSGTLS